jgi:hypothetical protein
MADALDFAINLGSVRDRLVALEYFLSVTDILAASEALDDTVPASPPAAFVAVSRESAEPNKLIGAHAQRVNATLAVLFVESAARFDRSAKDQLERTRKAVIRQLVAWTPDGAGHPLNYVGYRVAGMDDGLVWGEASFATSWRLSTTA